MSKNRFQKYIRLNLWGREYVIEDRLPNGNLRIRDALTDELRSFAETELIEFLFAGQLFFLGDKHSAPREAAEKFVGDLTMLKDDDPRKKEVLRRWAYVKAVLDSKLIIKNASTLKPLIRQVHTEIQDQGKPPNWKTVYYHWVMPYLECGEDTRALVPDFNKRGNSRRRFGKAPCHKLSEIEQHLALEVSNVIDEVIKEEYLSTQQLSVQAVYDKLEARITEINQLRDSGNQLPVPHKNSVYQIVSKLDPYEKDRARYGKRYAEQKHHCNNQAPQPTRPLERTEIDHTKLDLFVVDDDTRMPLGRPTLTTLLDKFSRAVLGIHVGFDPPSYLSVMRCLNQGIKPKTYLKSEFPEVKNDWEAYGLPEVIVVDNGKEFRSKDFEDACLQLGIVVMYSPPYVPRYKGAIERFFGTENKRLLHQQRGTTFSNIFERHGYDPEKNAVISFDAFMTMLHVWIVDIYHQSYHRGLKDIPAHVWREEIKQYPPALPRRMEDLWILLGHIEHRVIGPSGIELFTLFYNCEELARLRRRTKVKDKVVVKYDPSDLSTIYVYDHHRDRYIAVPAMDQEYSKELSLWQHRVIQSNARRDVKGRININGLREAKNMIQGIVQGEVAKRSKVSAKSKVARWENLRQPNYEAHLSLHQPEASRTKHPLGREDVALISTNETSFSGISEVTNLSLPEGVVTDNNHLVAGVLELTAATKKRRLKKSHTAVTKKKRNEREGSSMVGESVNNAETPEHDDGEDLDMTGFDAGYDLPGKEIKHDRQAS